MKQHIAVDQLNEILGNDFSEESFEKIAIPMRTDLFGMYEGLQLFDRRPPHKALEECVKEITIGQMFRLLEKNFASVEKYHGQFTVVLEFETDIKFEVEEKSFLGDELCDALWDAVKFTLFGELDKD